MKSVRYGVFIALVVVASLAELAIAQNPAKPDWREGFRTHDENGDGKIDRGEFQNWMVDVFFHRDTNHKGYLVFADVQNSMSLEGFKGRDSNGDGRLSVEEFLNSLFQDFEAADVNKSGSLSMEEIANYIKAARK